MAQQQKDVGNSMQAANKIIDEIILSDLVNSIPASKRETHANRKTRAKRKDTRRFVSIFSREEVVKVSRERSSDEHSAELSKLSKEQDMKPLVEARERHLKRLSYLKQKFPNFKSVIELYEMSLAMALQTAKKSIQMRPLLLIGPPGVGKTRFLLELSKALGCDFYKIDMSSVTAGFVLSGNTSQWGGSKPGFVSQSLRNSKVANPIFFVDEIDKTREYGSSNPLNAFYTLLEKHAADAFLDEYLNVHFDCSYINWLASANYIENIEAAVLSRMQVIHIDMPSDKEAQVIAQSIYDELLEHKEWLPLFESKLSKAVLTKMAGISPRQMSQVIEVACQKRFTRSNWKPGRNKLRLQASDIVIPSVSNKIPIGFVHE